MFVRFRGLDFARRFRPATPLWISNGNKRKIRETAGATGMKKACNHCGYRLFRCLVLTKKMHMGIFAGKRIYRKVIQNKLLLFKSLFESGYDINFRVTL